MDEGGNFDFSKKGTKYFTLTSITTPRTWRNLYSRLSEEKYNLIEWGLEASTIEYFHCSEDNRYVRSKVFDILSEEFQNNHIKIDSIVVEKAKTHPVLQSEEEFYSRMLGYLLKYIFSLSFFETADYKEIIVITDKIPINKKRQAVEKAIKEVLSDKLKPLCKKYKILHHNSSSHFALQIVDYCNWAVFRKWESNKDQYYKVIQPFLRSEFNIFEGGNIYYY